MFRRKIIYLFPSILICCIKIAASTVDEAAGGSAGGYVIVTEIRRVVVGVVVKLWLNASHIESRIIRNPMLCSIEEVIEKTSGQALADVIIVSHSQDCSIIRFCQIFSGVFGAGHPVRQLVLGFWSLDLLRCCADRAAVRLFGC